MAVQIDVFHIEFVSH